MGWTPEPGAGCRGETTSGPYAAAGYHEQATLDAACSGIVSLQPQPCGSNVTQHDTPVYNTNAVLQLIRDCVSNDSYMSYTKLVFEHGVTPTVGTADGTRAALLQHLFCGGCAAGQGAGCKTVLYGEKWPQSAGIKIIDLTCKWMDDSVLTTKDLVYICQALEGPIVSKQRRWLLAKLVSRRHLLVSALEAADCSIPDAMRSLGSSSTLAAVRATCTAHDIPVSQTDEKEVLVSKVLDHVTQGNCAERLAAGCDCMMNEASRLPGTSYMHS